VAGCPCEAQPARVAIFPWPPGNGILTISRGGKNVKPFPLRRIFFGSGKNLCLSMRPSGLDRRARSRNGACLCGGRSPFWPPDQSHGQARVLIVVLSALRVPSPAASPRGLFLFFFPCFYALSPRSSEPRAWNRPGGPVFSPSSFHPRPVTRTKPRHGKTKTVRPRTGVVFCFFCGGVNHTAAIH